MENETTLLLVDCDGVICDFDSAFLHLLNSLTKQNKTFPQGEPTVWDWPTEELKFTPDQVSQAWEVIAKEGGYFWEYDVKPLPGAEEALNVLSLLNQTGQAEVYFITSRPGPRAQVRTAKWLMSWGYMGPPAVIVTEDKGAVAKALRANSRESYAVDDKPENVCQFAIGGVACSYLVNRKHNNRDTNDLRFWASVIQRVPDLKAALVAAELVGQREEVAR